MPNFEEIYETLTPTKKEYFKLFLSGKTDQEISEIKYRTTATVRKHITEVVKAFGYQNAKDEHFSYRTEVIELFVKHRPDLVSQQVIQDYLGENPPQLNLESPEESVSLKSSFYVERQDVDCFCYQEILKEGSIIPIKAPKQMGKTSLLDRILDFAEKHSYNTVRINFRQVEPSNFSNIKKFMRWFCVLIQKRLTPSAIIDNYWDEEIGGLISSTNYLAAVLKSLEYPLVLALDEVDKVFDYPEIYQLFLPLLRSWNEEANNSEEWENLRLVISHSTEDYGRLDINQSPFNIGRLVELVEFDLSQVEDLAKRHHLKLTNSQLKSLMSLVGGHPYLIRVSLYNLARQKIQFETLLKEAGTNTSIYQRHLQRHLISLNENLALKKVFMQILTSDKSIEINPIQAYQLEGMGLIKKQQDFVSIRCQLYRLYFQKNLKLAEGESL